MTNDCYYEYFHFTGEEMETQRHLPKVTKHSSQVVISPSPLGGSDEAPLWAMAMNTDWRELIELACCLDKVYVTWRPVGFQSQQEEGHS